MGHACTTTASYGPRGSIAALTPTVARLLAIDAPHLTSEPPIAAVLERHAQYLASRPIERCLIFCPDALGVHLWDRYPEYRTQIAASAELCVPLISVVPPVTPVCFASMFTGGQPAQHGIREYERPVLECDTLFDAAVRAGKRVALIACRDSSMDLIFRLRSLDYFSEEYDPEVTARTLQVLGEDRHELIVVYQQEYDDLLHRTEPFSLECLRALANHVESFAAIAAAAAKAWQRHSRAVLFAPDHGAHLDAKTGHGDHGLDIPEDMRLYHWYGLFPGP